MRPHQIQYYWLRLQMQDHENIWGNSKGLVDNSSDIWGERTIMMRETTNSRFNVLQIQSGMDVNATWTEEDEQRLFTLHRHYGNKWSNIALKLPNLKDNDIKNKFYSTIRRGYRKLNKYISNIKRKQATSLHSSIKLIKPDFLTKLNALADRNHEEKYEARPIAIQIAPEIQSLLISMARNSIDYGTFEDSYDYSQQQSLLKKIQEFNKNCKRRKGKRKQRGVKNQEEESGEDEQHEQSKQEGMKQDSKSLMKEEQIGEQILLTRQNALRDQSIPFKQKLFAINQQKEQFQQESSQMFSQKFDIMMEQNSLADHFPSMIRSGANTPCLSFDITKSSKFLTQPSPYPHGSSNGFEATSIYFPGSLRMQHSVGRQFMNDSMQKNTREDNCQIVPLVQKKLNVKNQNGMLYQSINLMSRQFGETARNPPKEGEARENSDSNVEAERNKQLPSKDYEKWIPVVQTKEKRQDVREERK